MRLYWEIARLALQRQLTYRAAMWAGLMTNIFFGLLRAAVMIALFAARPVVAGYTLQDAVTYTGLSQALIAYLSIFGWYEVINSVHSGEVATDLLRPMHYFGFWLAADFGRAIVNLFLRGVPIMLIYALVVRITTPASVGQWLVLTVAILLSWLVSFTFRFLVNLAAFWTPNAAGIGRFAFGLLWVFSGFFMPLRFFPNWFRAICDATPFPATLNTPVEVYLGLLTGPESGPGVDQPSVVGRRAHRAGASYPPRGTAQTRHPRRLTMTSSPAPIGFGASIRWHLSLYRRLIGAQIRSQAQYRVAFLIDVLGTALSVGSFFLSLALVLQRFGNLGGWTLGEIAFLYGMLETSFGFMDMIFSGFDPARIWSAHPSRHVRPTTAAPHRYHGPGTRQRVCRAPSGAHPPGCGDPDLRHPRDRYGLDTGQGAVFSVRAAGHGRVLWWPLYHRRDHHVLDRRVD